VKVLVTGCHGFLGHHVTAALLARGHTVIGVDRITGARSPKANRIAEFEKFGRRVLFREGDLSKWPFTEQVITSAKPDAIFHAAGQYSISYTTKNLAHYIHGNLVLPVLVLEAAAIAKVPRVVYASSQSISDARQPSGLYGASKAFGEEALWAYGKRKGLSGVSLRYGVLYGPMIRPDTDFFRVVNNHLAGRGVQPSSQYDKRTPMIEIGDAAEIAVRSIESKADGVHTIPAIAPDGSHTYREVLLAAARITGLPARDIEGEPVRSIPAPPDLSSVRKLLGWVPSVALPQGLERYIPWARTATT
jgi:UDP-glucuronate 4-epimerase